MRAFGGTSDAPDQRPDGLGDVFPALVAALDLALGEQRLVEEDQPVRGPSHGCDGRYCSGVHESALDRGWPETGAAWLRLARTSRLRYARTSLALSVLGGPDRVVGA